VIISHPIQQRRRHQKRLLTINSNKVLGHREIVLNPSDDTPFTRQPHGKQPRALGHHPDGCSARRAAARSLFSARLAARRRASRCRIEAREPSPMEVVPRFVPQTQMRARRLRTETPKPAECRDFLGRRRHHFNLRPRGRRPTKFPR
jgi:hypothetical protein